ncbi:hypothetical protein ACFQ6Q_15870 [Streptomyces sp. NPDC056437]|uniref:hypothetical protein n=1 Tax=Streptomyces sp. NPDC056437 TaxID=3345816 RepID=UPI0036930920
MRDINRTPDTGSDDQNSEKTSRSEALRTWWNDAWTDGGVLHGMWDDVRTAPNDGWHGMAHWIKAVLGAAGVAFVILLLHSAASVLLGTLHDILTAAPDMQAGTDTSTGVWATIDQPVRSYITSHTTGLPISASTVYTLWQATGFLALVGGFITRNSGLRLTWLGFGAATVAMIWTATPDTSRTIAALAWMLLSAFALRGLRLRRPAITHVTTTGPAIRPEIHIPAQATPADTKPIKPYRT